MSRERREAILDEFEKSGMAGAAFAKMIGVKYQTFASWTQKRRKARGQAACGAGGTKAPVVKLVEAIVGAASCEVAVLTIELPGGARVKVASAEQMELVCRFLATLSKLEMRGC